MKISEIKTINDLTQNSFRCPICDKRLQQSSRDLYCYSKDHKYWQDFYHKNDGSTERGVETFEVVNSKRSVYNFFIRNDHSYRKNSHVYYKNKDYWFPIMEIDINIIEKAQNFLLLQ